MAQEQADGPPTPAALDALKNEFGAAMAEADDAQALRLVKSSFLGPKGRLTRMLRHVGRLPAEDRRAAGQAANALKRELEAKLSDRLKAKESDRRAKAAARAAVDVTLPARPPVAAGALHPVTQVMGEMLDILSGLGFVWAGGREVELDWYNFEALNFPPDHPARDMQDTFFVSPPDGADGPAPALLRTHTSSVQIRTLEAEKAPLRIVAPGRVFRCDSDATHSPMFHQIEGLWVDEGVSMADLKGVLTHFIHALFGARRMRFRPSYFPFVEPGAEVDMECVFCEGNGCRVCKETGWMEILGCGMVHPNVLRACGVDAERYSGFAFGLGVDRVAMLKYRIDDLGHLFRGDLRILQQFSGMEGVRS